MGSFRKAFTRGSSLVFIVALFAGFQPAFAEWDGEDKKPDPEQNQIERSGRTRPTPTRVTEEENSSVSTRPGADPELKRKLGPRGEGRLFSWWSPETYKYSIGYEKAGTANAVLGGDNLTFGFWFPGDFGLDLFLGYNKTGGTTTEARTVQETGVTSSKTRVTTTQYSGATGPSNMTVGLTLKGRGYQNSWFQFNYGIIVAYGGSSRVESRVGQIIETIPDTGAPTTKSVQETSANGSAGYGTTTAETKSTISVGPKLGTEFYLKWFPHLALGFSTGVLASFGGDTTTTTVTKDRTLQYVNGVEQPNVSGTDGPLTTTATTTPGTRAGTFGIGGTLFQLNGIFTIRYIW